MSNEKAAEALVRAMHSKGEAAVALAVKLLEKAHGSGRPAETGDVALTSEKDAYRVQDEVYGLLWPGKRPTAWKAGGPSDKVETTAAPIAPARVFASPASVAGASMAMIGVEAEVAFRFARDLPLRTRPYSERSVAAAVGEVLVAIELCDTRLTDWKRTSGLWKLADMQNNSGLVVGSGTREWKRIDFLQQEVEFHVGARVVKAKGAHSYGNPLRLLPRLVKHCAKRGHGLHAGDIVTTGAWTGLEIANAGDEVTAQFPGIGEATVRID